MATQYHDVQITERVTMGPRNRAEKVYRVSAITSGGTFFSIEIPEDEFSVENVRDKLSARALVFDEVLNS